MVYFGFLPKDRRDTYRPVVVDLVKNNYELDDETMRSITDLQKQVAEGFTSRKSAAKDSITKILDVLFHSRDESEMEVRISQE